MTLAVVLTVVGLACLAVVADVFSGDPKLSTTSDAVDLRAHTSSLLLGRADLSGEDWRPADVGTDSFLWCVVGMSSTGGLVYHRVVAADQGEAMAGALREINDMARIIGASPVSL